MKLTIDDIEKSIRGHLEITSTLEQHKLQEVVLDQRPFTFQGDTKFAKRWLIKLEANRAKMAKRALEDEEYRNWLVEAEASADIAAKSLAADPTDTNGTYTPDQLELREKKRLELQGEDLPSAHARPAKVIEAHKNFDGPYIFDLREDDILALVELIDRWTTKNSPSSPMQVEDEEEEQSGGSGSVPTPDKLVLGDLMKILGILKRQCDTIRERRLVKTQTRTKTMVH